MTTNGWRLERDCKEFAVYTEGTSARLHNIPLHKNPYQARTVNGDIWELAWGRTDQALHDLEDTGGKVKMEYNRKCLPGDEPRIEVTEEFVEKNKFHIDQNKAKEIMGRDSFLYFGYEVAINFVPFEANKPFLKDEYIKKVESGETEYSIITDVMEAAQDFLDYMVFAWMKAMDERGISASRSIQKLSAWMEILGRQDIADILNDESLYNPYGRPALKKACEKLGISYPDYL